MKLYDAIMNIDKSTVNSQWVSTEELGYELGVETGNEDSNKRRLNSFWLQKHLCTDTWVGVLAFFLDDEFVGLSVKNSRKGDTIYEWVLGGDDKVRDYLVTLIDKEGLYQPTIIDFDEEIGEGYSVDYGGQLLTDRVIHIPSGELVTVTCKWSDYGDIKSWSRIGILFESGKRLVVNTSEILVPYCLSSVGGGSR